MRRRAGALRDVDGTAGGLWDSSPPRNFDGIALAFDRKIR